MAYLINNGQRIFSAGKYLIGEVPLLLSNWYLPSRDEVQLMRSELYLESVGGFTASTNDADDYWSSSESSNSGVAISMNSGDSNSWGKFISRRMRAARTITYVPGAYSLRDTGPGGGLIFYVNGGTYMEAAIADQSASYTWMNPYSAELVGTGFAIGDGLTNTLAIVAKGYASSAALLCYNYTP